VKSAIIVLLLITVAFAQSKIGYVDTQVLFEKSSEAKTIQNKIKNLEKEYTDLITKMQGEYQDLGEKYQTQKLILTEAKKNELVQAIQKKEADIQEFQKTKTLYPSGELYQRAQEIKQPLIEKIMKAVEAVSKEKGVDLMLDNVNTIVLYANTTINYTAEVLQYLEKNSTKKGN
jgi:outer membrane protein